MIRLFRHISSSRINADVISTDCLSPPPPIKTPQGYYGYGISGVCRGVVLTWAGVITVRWYG